MGNSQAADEHVERTEGGKLRPAEIKRAEQWFKDKGVRTACPECGTQSTIAAYTVFVPVGQPSERRFPAVALYCTNCSRTRLFSAVIMGLVTHD